MAIKKLLKKSPSRKRGSRNSKKYEKENVNIVKKKQNKTLVTQDLKFARSLASNDKKRREKTLKKLRVWISVRSKTSFAFSEMDLMRLWKGLFYCMWMSDKPLIQEDLAESISQLVHCFESKELTILYTKCALKALSTEWFGIDQYRLDKFQMLVRRIIRQTFYVCKKQSWDMDWINGVSKVFEEILLNEKCPLGLSFHITDIYCEELAKVSEGDIPENVVAELLRPFAINLAIKNDNRQIRHTTKQVFRYLMFQSDVGMDYKEKFEAWSKAGFPTGNIDAMEKVELSDDDVDDDELEEELDDEMMGVDMMSDKKQQSKPLDPRAGRVDVEIPQLPFDPNGIVELLSECKMNPSSTPKTRKNISILIDQFKEIAQGSMPLGIKTVDLPTRKNPETNPTKAAKRLLELEDKLFETSCSRRKKARIEMKKKKRVEKKSEAPAETTIETEVETPIDSEAETPVETEVEIPHVAPVEKKVDTPVKTKVKSPVMKKVKTPIKTPVKTLTETPVKTPKTPTITSVKTPIKTPVKTSTETPVKTPKTPKITSVKTPIKTPVKTSTETPVKTPKTPTITSVKTPIKTPVETSTETPVKTPKTPTITSVKTSTVTPVKTPLKTPTKTPTVKTPTKKSTVKTPIKTTVQNSTETPVKTPCKTPTITSVKVSTATPVKTVTPLKSTLKTPSNSPTKTPIMSAIKLMDLNSSTKKKVRIVLQKNTAQNVSEYDRQLRISPQIPYDKNRKPPAGVLKPSPFSSPRNPFYKSNIKYCK